MEEAARSMQRLQLHAQVGRPQAEPSDRGAASRDPAAQAQGVQPATPLAEGEPQAEGALALLPEAVLDHVLTLLASEEGGSCIRATCSWLRSAFDRCNTRLVLREPHHQLPLSFPARVLDVVRSSPRVSSLALTEGLQCLTWPRVLEAGGPALLQRLERLLLMHRPKVLDLDALGACTRLQRLSLRGHAFKQIEIDLQPLEACGATLRQLDIQDCTPVRDFAPLAACTALQQLTLGNCRRLENLAPLAACAQLQQLRISGGQLLRDLSALAACVQLQTLEMDGSWELSEAGPLAACIALRELRLPSCQVARLDPLASCVLLQRLDLRECGLVADLGPLAACTALLELDLTACSRVASLAPLAPCIGLQQLKLSGCMRVEDLSPLAACTQLQTLSLARCEMVANLGPLAACVALKSLSLEGCRKVQCLRPLVACSGLKSLQLDGCEALGAQGQSNLALLGRLGLKMNVKTVMQLSDQRRLVTSQGGNVG